MGPNGSANEAWYRIRLSITESQPSGDRPGSEAPLYREPSAVIATLISDRAQLDGRVYLLA